jgi:polyisoprenyl-phosphate glycosyltransferase
MTSRAENLTILLPVYNDWESLRIVMKDLDVALAGKTFTPNVIVLDDASTNVETSWLRTEPLRAIQSVEVLRLRRNLGHQRAIAIGIAFIAKERPCDAVVVMDADGEDKPSDVLLLLDRFLQDSGRSVVFAERTRRSESALFRACYQIYRALHLLLTGIAVKVGNFSALSFEHVATLSVVSELWNHYAASVFKSRLPTALVPTERGTRIAGDSKHSFVPLVLHGLSAISVFAETVGVRLIVAIGIAMTLTSGLLAAVVGVRLGTDLAIPGWATTAFGLLLVIILQMLTLVIGLTLTVLFNRNNLTFLPARDYRYFIAATEILHGERK